MISQWVELEPRMRARSPLLVMIFVTFGALANGGVQAGSTAPQQEIQAVLNQQIVAWNRGDVAGFMEGYWKSPDLIYFSNKTKVRGWQTLLDRYRQLFQPPNESRMGSLSLPEVEILMLGRDSAIVWGTYLVQTSDGKTRGGLYTIAMRRLPEGWRAVYDRTSVEQDPQTQMNSQ